MMKFTIQESDRSSYTLVSIEQANKNQGSTFYSILTSFTINDENRWLAPFIKKFVEEINREAKVREENG